MKISKANLEVGGEDIRWIGDMFYVDGRDRYMEQTDFRPERIYVRDGYPEYWLRRP